ncbi:DUF3095 domain-containing protein [Oscillatoria sp. CS-180]|uniref:DUF3095 domain-containing protein n=1 Tax=Oscillatoria sp. CS-180 TaxID=3021720 RepID=UPI00232DD26B|nr:DUF3095 domain-containing protein [Oscillatoria sp. CS-180]MDB9525621.1 DUF3095 domain-containing protein [Oscillatoria sp. CS-180]
MNTLGFYADLPTLTNWLDLTNPNYYVQVPDDWYVLITDITGSTKAIEDGLYKEVNLLGASSIVAVLNELKPLDIPFVFGGDGASLVIPPDCLGAAREALIGVRAVAREAFDMELRVGAVPMAIVSQRYPLKVAKFRLSPLYCQASFIGGGLTFATDLVKQDAVYRLDVDGNPARANLTGLECRWQEIPSAHGSMLSLIVAALESSGVSSEQTYRDVLKTIQSIFGDPEQYHPITEQGLRLSFNPRKLSAEVKAKSPSSHSLARLQHLVRICLENVLGTAFMGLRLSLGGVNWGKYKHDVRTASDYQKIDDVLRMVISGTSDQFHQLTDYLNRWAKSGQLAYGIHVSDRALLTCLILERRDCHFHLVDGAEGGYALAAKGLKQQLHQKRDNWRAYADISRRRKPSSSLSSRTSSTVNELSCDNLHTPQ